MRFANENNNYNTYWYFNKKKQKYVHKINFLLLNIWVINGSHKIAKKEALIKVHKKYCKNIVIATMTLTTVW